MPEQRTVEQWLRRYAAAGGVTCSLLALLVLAGWLFEIETLKRVRAGEASMKFNTALCFFLSGTAILGLYRENAGHYRHLAGYALAASALGLAVASVSQDAFGWSLGIDELLVRDVHRTSRTAFPGRMSESTAVAFVFCGIGLLTLNARRLQLFSQLWSGLGFLTGFTGLLNYIYRAPVLYTLPGFSSMAMHTSVGFCVLGSAILCSRPHSPLLQPYIEESTGGVMLRRLTPFAFLAPILFALLANRALVYGAVGSSTLALIYLAVSSVLVSLWLLRRNAAQLTLSEQRRISEKISDLNAYSAKLKGFARRLTQTEQKERKRIAGILHDDLQQLIAAAVMRQETLDKDADSSKIEQVREQTVDLLRRALEETRSLTVRLSPPILRHGDFAAALNWLGKHMREQYELNVDVAVEAGCDVQAQNLKVFLFDAVRELLFNVVKHADATKARLTVTQDDERLYIAVEDDGRGCDIEEMNAGQAAGKSFGLMSVVERLEMWGGEFDMRERGDGGCAVTLTVPLAAAEKEAEEEEKDESPALTPEDTELSNCRILIVDDHPIMREGVRNMLKDEKGFSIVGEAEDGKQAVALAEKVRPNAIIMDVNLPKLNGIDATREIVQQFPDITVIALSINDDQQTRKAMKKAGAAAYLLKDGPAEELKSTIRKVC